LNFAGPERGLLEISSLIGVDFQKARRLIDYCERVVVASYAHLGDEGPNDFHLLNKDDEDQVWQALGQFSLDSRGVTFNFSPYVVMAYAFGTDSHHSLGNNSGLFGRRWSADRRRLPAADHVLIVGHIPSMKSARESRSYSLLSAGLYLTDIGREGKIFS
jgi:hypothetical protein